MDEKYFMWYDSDRGPTQGPHYVGDVKAVGGKNLYHSLDQLLKMNISESLKKRLTSAKVGTRIKVHYLHSNGDLMLKRLSSEEIKSASGLKELLKVLDELNKKIYKVEVDCEKLKEKLMK